MGRKESKRLISSLFSQSPKLKSQPSISRFVDAHECTRRFTWIVHQWGLPELDLFTTAINTKLSKFISRLPHPQAEAIDALLSPLDIRSGSGFTILLSTAQIFAGGPKPRSRAKYTKGTGSGNFSSNQ